jgi:hypothetical protein
MKMKKVLMMLLLVLSMLTVPAMAADSTDYAIDNVYIDGLTAEGNTIYVERGDEISVDVRLSGVDDGDADTETVTDVQVKTWLGGYEYDDVTVTSEMFDVEEGVSYREILSLELPEDMNAEQDYTIYVEIFDDVDSLRESYTVRVSADRHLVDIMDINLETVDAGDYTTATVRLENMGDHKEEDILVTLSIADLGISVSEYLDELAWDEIDNEDEEDSGEVTLTFEVDDCVEAGDYEAMVSVTYNRGYDTVEETTSLSVSSDACEVASEDDDSSVTVVVTGDDETEDESSDFSTALRLGFGILAVLIVILALILIVRR